MTLLDRLDHLNRPKVLSHIDSVCDNFLFLPDGDLRLIDWEYSGMCDPLIDVSMCAIYSYYNDFEVEKLIKLYLHRGTDVRGAVRLLRLYCPRRIFVVFVGGV